MMCSKEFYVRDAIASDAEAIWQLNRDDMGYQYPLNETVQNIERILGSSTDRIFVAISDGAIVGYVHANDYDLIFAPHRKNIMSIAVSNKYRRQGVGRALLKKVEQWALETGASGIRLVSSENRTGAHAFYRSCGYEGKKKQINFKKMF